MPWIASCVLGEAGGWLQGNIEKHRSYQRFQKDTTPSQTGDSFHCTVPLEGISRWLLFEQLGMPQATLGIFMVRAVSQTADRAWRSGPRSWEAVCCRAGHAMGSSLGAVVAGGRGQGSGNFSKPLRASPTDPEGFRISTGGDVVVGFCYTLPGKQRKSMNNRKEAHDHRPQFTGGCHHSRICWKSNMAGHGQLKRFLQCIGRVFWSRCGKD